MWKHIELRSNVIIIKSSLLWELEWKIWGQKTGSWGLGDINFSGEKFNKEFSESELVILNKYEKGFNNEHGENERGPGHRW